MSEGIVVLVCGGREYDDYDRVASVLEEIYQNCGIRLLVHGAASGADRLADEWAESIGLLRKPYPADWLKLGRAAGPIRNQQMLEDSKPDLVVAFPGKRGTADMVRRAKAAGVKVMEVS